MTDDLDLSEQLLAGVFDLPLAEQSAALESLCAQHPRLSELLRRGFAAVQEARLLETPATPGRPARDDLPPDVPGLRIVRRLGRGGMGAVYLAEQTSPVRRMVAVKVLRGDMLGRQVLVRFEQERQALARMSHPHVAQVYGAGATSAGDPYFSMEYVEGTPIRSYCDENGVGLSGRLELLLQVCDGVQHAHQRGLIHRDLKPSNILVGGPPDRPQTKIIDFGIAKAVEGKIVDDTLHTEHGAIIGTPAYMSPEQAGGDPADVDIRTDVYALGVILYELLSGDLPFASLRGRPWIEALRVIREEQPVRPSARATRIRNSSEGGSTTVSWTRRLRGDLDWITMKALEKDRDRRYASASELAADVRRHLEHVPVLAGPPSRIYRLRRFVRRNRVLVAAGVAVVLTAGVGATVAYGHYLDARAQEATAVHEKQLADERRDEAIGQRNEAVRQKKRADARFRDMQGILDILTQDVARDLEDMDVAAPVRKKILNAAERYLNIVIEEAESDPSLRRSLAETYRGLGTLGIREFGAVTRTVEYLKQATVLLRTLLQESPEDHQLFRDYCRSVSHFVAGLQVAGVIDKAEAELERLIREAPGLAPAEAKKLSLPEYLGAAWTQRGFLMPDSRVADRIRFQEIAIRTIEDAFAGVDVPNKVEHYSILARAYADHYRATLLADPTRPVVASLEKAEKCLEKLKHLRPTDPETRDVANLLQIIKAARSSTSEQVDAVIAAGEKELRRLLQQLEADPDNPTLQFGVAYSRFRVGLGEWMRGRLTRGRQLLDQSLGWFEEAKVTDDLAFQRISVLRAGYRVRAELREKFLDDEGAMRDLEAASRLPLGRDDVDSRLDRLSAQAEIGRLQVRAKDPARAIETLTRVLAALGDRPRDQRSGMVHASIESSCRAALGSARWLDLDRPGAVAEFERSSHCLRNFKGGYRFIEGGRLLPNFELVFAENILQWSLLLEFDSESMRRLRNATHILEGMKRLSGSLPTPSLDLQLAILHAGQARCSEADKAAEFKSAQELFEGVIATDSGNRKARYGLAIARLVFAVHLARSDPKAAWRIANSALDGLDQLIAEGAPAYVEVSRLRLLDILGLLASGKGQLDRLRPRMKAALDRVGQVMEDEGTCAHLLLECAEQYLKVAAYFGPTADRQPAQVLLARADKRADRPALRSRVFQVERQLREATGDIAGALSVLDRHEAWSRNQLSNERLQPAALGLSRERARLQARLKK